MSSDKRLIEIADQPRKDIERIAAENAQDEARFGHKTIEHEADPEFEARRKALREGK